MKKVKYILGIVGALLASSCSSTYHTGNTAADDVYYSSKDNQVSSVQPTKIAPAPVSSDSYNTTKDNSNYSNNTNYSQDNSGQNQANDYSGQNQSGDNSSQKQANDNSGYSNSSSNQAYDSKGNTYITNNYYDDYYDYEYSSRIRRFYTPAYGYGYYDPFYTNSYWYDYNPVNWGVSIYLGYNWWAPSFYYYQPFCYGSGFSVGFGYGNFGYSPYSYWGASPYYGYGSGYSHGYYHGYSNGYWNGYNDGYYGGNPNPYYYNSYDATSHYYGPRGSVSSNSPRSSSQRQSELAPLSVKYERAVSEGKVGKNSTNRSSDMIERAGSIKDKEIRQSTPQNSGINNSVRDNAGMNNSNIRKDNTSLKDQQNNEGRNLKQDNNLDGRNIKQDNGSGIKRNNNFENPSDQGIRQQPSNDTRNFNNGVRENNNINNQVTTPRSNNSNQNSGGNRLNNKNYNNVRPSSSPDISRPNMDKPERNINIPSESPQRFNNRQNIQIPKNEQPQIQDENSQRLRESDFSAPPTRGENKTPVFQPRNEPKQYKIESQPAPQRNAEPSRPSEPRSNNNGGGRRR